MDRRRKDPSTRKGPRGCALSRRRTCPDLAPCRLEAGRLSWHQRAGPSATLDSAVRLWPGSYEASPRVVKAAAGPDGTVTGRGSSSVGRAAAFQAQCQVMPGGARVELER